MTPSACTARTDLSCRPSALDLGRLAVLSAFATLAATGCGATTHAPVGPSAASLPAQVPAAVSEPIADILALDAIASADLRCNQNRSWGLSYKHDADETARKILAMAAPGAPATVEKEVSKMIFWRLVRAVIVDGEMNNLGVISVRGHSWTDSQGRVHPLLVFRSGVTPNPEAEGSCFRSLLDAGHVRHVVNMFDGDLPITDLVAAEGRAAAARGATYRSLTDDPEAYGPWRDELRRTEDPATLERASHAVARLVQNEILAPGGTPPRGNVYMHCGGGMHRSGMVAGVIEKCVNHAPLAEVEAHYRFHTAFRDAGHPGGAEDGNLRFLRTFDCRLLDEAPVK